MMGAKATINGQGHTPQKLLKGARLGIPPFEIVETKAIGLGKIEPVYNL
jgi:hypothetical protein